MRTAIVLAVLMAFAITLLSMESSPSDAGFTSTTEVTFSGSVNVPQRSDQKVLVTTAPPASASSSVSSVTMSPSAAEPAPSPVEKPADPTSNIEATTTSSSASVSTTAQVGDSE